MAFVPGSASGNIVRGSALMNHGENPDEHVASDGFYKQGYKNPTIGNNAPEPFNQFLDKPSYDLKRQNSMVITISDSDDWRADKDVFLFAKLRATDVIYSITVLCDDDFNNQNFVLPVAYMADRNSQEPILWDEQTVTTTALTITDVPASSRSLFTFTTPDLVEAKDWYNHAYLTVSDSSKIPDGTYVIYNYARDGLGNVSFTLSTDYDSISGTYLRVGTASTTHTNQTATFTFTRSRYACPFFDTSVNPELDLGLPSNDATGELMNWNVAGRDSHSISKELVYANLNNTPSNSTFRSRSYPRLMRKDDVVYLGATFVRKPTFDSGKTYSRLGFSVTFGR